MACSHIATQRLQSLLQSEGKQQQRFAFIFESWGSTRRQLMQVYASPIFEAFDTWFADAKVWSVKNIIYRFVYR